MSIPLPPPSPRKPLGTIQSPLQAGHTPSAPARPKLVASNQMAYALLGGFYTYVVKLGLRGDTLAGWVFLLHPTRFELDAFEAIITEVAAEVDRICVGPRRHSLALNRTPITAPDQMNEDYFQSDVSRFEMLLCQKHGFKLLKAVHTPCAEIEPTIRVTTP
jgi:hypothetical protein